MAARGQRFGQMDDGGFGAAERALLFGVSRASSPVKGTLLLTGVDTITALRSR